jgi:hypothetical protein
MKMQRQTNIMKCTDSEPRPIRRWNLLLAAAAGVALAAVGCSSDSHKQAEYSTTKTTYTTSTQPATQTVTTTSVGAAETPGGQSSGYSTTTTATTTTTTTVPPDAITDPAMLPPNNLGPMYADRPVYFTHMRVERVISDRAIEVSSDDGSRFYVMCDQSTTNVKPGDFVVITGTARDIDNTSTALNKKGAYYLMHHPYWIQVDRIQIASS